VRSAIKRHYQKRTLPKPAHVEKLAANWHPYCSVACWYLWRSLDLPRTKLTAEARRRGGRVLLKSGPK
jgi:DNA-3-methyladenine glycosylase II